MVMTYATDVRRHVCDTDTRQGIYLTVTTMSGTEGIYFVGYAADHIAVIVERVG